MGKRAPGAHFTPALFLFLRELAQNNSREWLQANKPRYERDVRQPLLRFIADFAPHLQRISPHFRADPKPVGGSMFRLHRDVRFSLDKSPYKTHAAAQFRHARGRDVHAPGFYLHLEPDQAFAGAGLWHPDTASQRRLRDAIVSDPQAWRRVVSSKAFRAHLRLEGDRLKRPPRGYDPQHPLLEDLKRKDFICAAPLTEAAVTADDFLPRFVQVCRAGAPFVGFLTRALDLPW